MLERANSVLTKIFERRDARIAAFVVVVCIGATLLVAFDTSSPEVFQQPEQLTVQESEAVLPAAQPVSIRIPAIDLEAAFEEPLGLAPDGEIAVPKQFDTVGWYKHGPTPGELGPAVVIGHVDSKAGPEVFYDLRKLKAGDKVEIERKDGTRAVFEVTELEQVDQRTFPAERVYGDIDHAGLRLITCSGTYDRGERRYSHNLIVYARLVTETTE